MKSTLLKTVLTGAVLLGASMSSQAASLTKLWDVSNAGYDCGQESHGLWTNDAFTQADPYCDGFDEIYYGFNAGSTLAEYDNGTAQLTATAINGNGSVANINISFSSFSDDHNGRTVKLNNAEVLAGDFAQDWTFYTHFEGTIEIWGQTFNMSIGDMPAMQIGQGANDKDDNFGASMWMLVNNWGPAAHWDLNMNLEALDIPEVPAPAGLGILALGLFGLAAARKRKAA